MAELVNKEREERGLNPLKIDAEMTEFAMQRSMELSVLFSHTRPDGSGFYSPYMGSLWAENAAEYQASAEEVMESWMNSEGHRENILTSYFTRIGVGCVEVEGRCYWIQWFSKYDTDAYEKPANRTVSLRIGFAVDVFGDAPITGSVVFYFHRPPEYSYIINMDKDAYTVDVGGTQQVNVTLTGYCISENGEFWNAPIPYPADELCYEIADPSVAEIHNGVLTGKANGVTTLTVRTANGNYTMQADVFVGPPQYGDADCNGTVNTLDAAMVLRHAVKLLELSKQGRRNADVNGDGEINTLDAATILRYVVKLITSWPAENP